MAALAKNHSTLVGDGSKRAIAKTANKQQPNKQTAWPVLSNVFYCAFWRVRAAFWGLVLVVIAKITRAGDTDVTGKCDGRGVKRNTTARFINAVASSHPTDVGKSLLHVKGLPPMHTQPYPIYTPKGKRQRNQHSI